MENDTTNDTNTQDGQNARPAIRVGAETPPRFLQKDLQLVCHAPQLRRHINRPWLRAYITQHVGPILQAVPPGGEATVTGRQMSHHALITGASGSGKSRLSVRLLVEQIKQGCSALVLDPKAETIAHLLAHAMDAGLSPEQVTLLDARCPDGVPGWNPLASELPVLEAVGDMVALLARINSSWGPRLQDLLTNALIVVASHRLSLFELVRFLQRDDYREGLLRQPCRSEAPDAYAEALEYFRSEYGAWSRSARTEAAGPVINKCRELLRNPFLRSLLCARRTTLDLGGLWCWPGLVLVHLDRATLGEEGTCLLAGLFANSLFRTALRSPGPVPVVLSLDELSTLEGFVGKAIIETVTFARSLGLRLQVACQHLAGLSDGLRSALLGNSAVQACFRLGPDDARFVGGVIAEGTEPRLARLSVGVDQKDRHTGVAASAEWRHVIRDGEGRPLRLRSDAWDGFTRDDLFGRDPAGLLRHLAAASGHRRLYVHAADTGEPVALDVYIRDLTVTDYWIDGPAPLELVVTFARPRLTHPEWWTATDAAHAWARELQALPVQHVALRVAGQGARVVRVADVPDPKPGVGEAYQAAILTATGQTLPEIEAARRWRTEQVECVATGRRHGTDNFGHAPPQDGIPAPRTEESILPTGRNDEREDNNDGSLA